MPSRCPTVSNVSRAVVLAVEALAPAGWAATSERDGADAALPRPGAGAETLDVPTANDTVLVLSRVIAMSRRSSSFSSWKVVFSAARRSTCRRRTRRRRHGKRCSRR